MGRIFLFAASFRKKVRDPRLRARVCIIIQANTSVESFGDKPARMGRLCLFSGYVCVLRCSLFVAENMVPFCHFVVAHVLLSVGFFACRRFTSSDREFPAQESAQLFNSYNIDRVRHVVCFALSFWNAVCVCTCEEKVTMCVGLNTPRVEVLPSPVSDHRKSR